MSSFREFMNSLEAQGHVHHIKRQVSVRFEAAAILQKYNEGPAIFFDKIKESPIAVAGNVLNSRTRLFNALHVAASNFYTGLLDAMRSPSKPKLVTESPLLEVREKPRLSRLPVLTHYEKDGGPYITSAILSARSPQDDVENVSFHRLLVLDDNHVVARLVPRHLHKLFKLAQEKNQALDVAVAIGNHPAVALAAASSPPFGISEFHVAQRLLKGRFEIIECPDVNAAVPAQSEIALEGKILPDKTAKEGPFVDLLGTYDAVRDEPVIEIVRVMRRRQSIYHAILAGGAEHRILMGIGREAKVWESARQVVPSVKAVNLSEGGCGWLHAIVSLDKQSDGDAKNVILAAFAAHPSLKHVIAVDSDINIYDLKEVEWAIATRFRGDRGLVVIPHVRGSTLDAVAEPDGTTTKIGVDATRPLNKPREVFEKGVIPVSPETVKRLTEP